LRNLYGRTISDPRALLKYNVRMDDPVKP